MHILWVTFGVVVLDQLTKQLVMGVNIPWLGLHFEGMRYGYSVPVLGNFFRLTYIENAGMAFGIDPGGKLFFSLFSIALTIGIFYYLITARQEPPLARLALALILGGAVGNLIDRTFYGLLFQDGALFYGRVVDFLDVDFFDINIFGYALSRWPVFNIADAAVTVGIFMLLIAHWGSKKSGSPSDSQLDSAKNDAAGSPAP